MLEELTHEDVPASQSEPARRLDEACRKAAQDALHLPEVFASLTGTIRHIAADYRHRAVFEMIQNAHDALGGEGADEIRIVFRRTRAGSGTLLVANRGRGFAWENVSAVRLPAQSTKSYGEGIGNKGLGFRSVMSLTSVPEVYSCLGNGRPRDAFDGFCFRFADDAQAAALFEDAGGSPDQVRSLLRDVPRSMLALPVDRQSSEVREFARQGYATLVRIELPDADAVSDVEAQISELRDAETPPTLFLDRIGSLVVETQMEGSKPSVTRILRQSSHLFDLPGAVPTSVEKTRINGTDFLVVRRRVEKAAFETAVRNSLKDDNRLEEWLGTDAPTVVSVAVPLKAPRPRAGRVYCYLPLGSSVEAPIFGHLDAPFLASLNRKDFVESVPLNDFLLEACAGAALAAARHLAGGADVAYGIEPRAVVDLVAWRASHMRHVVKANGGRPPVNDEILPVAGGGWTSFRRARWWGAARTALKAPVLAEVAGAPLLDPRIGDIRLARLKEARPGLSLPANMAPNASEIAEWIEAVAKERSRGRDPWKGWDKFLDAVVGSFDDLELNLDALAGKSILYGGPSGSPSHVLPAQANEAHPVYLTDRGGRGRSREVRMPPRSLSRRVPYLDARIALASETRTALLKAGLVSEIDPVKILADHRRIVAANPKPETLGDILAWAFDVWSVMGKECEPTLREAHLRVPVASRRWIEAEDALMSGAWTEDGRRLEAVVAELVEVSDDAKRLRDRMLVHPGWGLKGGDGKEGARDAWAKFFDACGVKDGLHPIPAAPAAGYVHLFWRQYLAGTWKPGSADPHWVKEVANTQFRYSQSMYVSRAAHGLGFCHLPCQSEHGELSEEGRSDYAMLVLGLLRRVDPFTLKVGVHHESRGDHHDLPTPALSFLRQAAWLPCIEGSGIGFVPPRSVWWRRSRGREIPRSVSRPHEDVRTALVEETVWSRLKHLGLGDWSDAGTAFRRIAVLAQALQKAQPTSEEKPSIRSAVAAAWEDVVATKALPPPGLKIVAEASDMFVAVGPGEARLYVTPDMASMEARIVQDRGASILEGVAQPAVVATILNRAGIPAVSLADVDVWMEADGKRFVPSSSDPKLPAGGRGWLVHLAVLALDVEGRGFAFQVSRTAFRAALARVRLHFCDSLAVVVDGGEPIPLSERFVHLRDREHPTLMVVGRPELRWDDLRPLARALERLVDGRADGALRVCFGTVASEFAHTPFERPTNEALASALRWHPARIAQAFRSSVGSVDQIRDLVAPVIACVAGVDYGKALLLVLEQIDDFDLPSWLQRQKVPLPCALQEFVAACTGSEDRDSLRRRFSISLSNFNVALAALGQEPLTSRADLRGQFEFARRAVRDRVIERLRRHHRAHFVDGGSLSGYAQARTLSFIAYDPSWETTLEGVGETYVWNLASAAMDAAHGPDVPETLEPFRDVHPHNAEVAREAVRDAMPSVIAWCEHNGRDVPAAWRKTVVEIVRDLDDAGVLDFERLTPSAFLLALRLAGIWPLGMPDSLDPNTLGIDAKSVERARNWRADQQRKREAERRTISFGGQPYDAGNKADLAKLVSAALKDAEDDQDWSSRCGPATLNPISKVQSRSSRGGGGEGGGRGSFVVAERRMSEDQRGAIGLLGETRAFLWIRQRHGLTVEQAEAAWVSPNRAVSLLGARGTDASGFDFEVIKENGVRWRYEVKASTSDPGEFELGSSEVRAALEASADRSVKFRILYVPEVTTQGRWRVIELPNPMSPMKRGFFEELGRASIRFGFDPKNKP